MKQAFSDLKNLFVPPFVPPIYLDTITDVNGSNIPETLLEQTTTSGTAVAAGKSLSRWESVDIEAPEIFGRLLIGFNN